MNKYHAKKTVVDGIAFDSRREAKRWQELKLMERDGKIRGLRRQVRFELLPAFDVCGKHYRAITWIADFVYIEDGKEVAEDCKGYRTDVYRIKSKLFAYRYKKIIKET